MRGRHERNEKQALRELIGTKKFAEIFKNMIRDYYTYGYKSYSQFVTGEKQLRNRWLILSDALGEQWEFVKKRNGRNRITLRTMQRGDDHTIEDLYFLHYMKEWGDYINCLFDLDPCSCLREGIKALPVSADDLCMVRTNKGNLSLQEVNEPEFAIIDNWISGLNDTSEVGQYTNEGHNPTPRDDPALVPVRVNRQLNIWSPMTRTFKPKADSNGLYKNLSNRTGVMEAFGILGNLKNDPKAKMLWLSLEMQKYCQDDTRLHRPYKKDLSSALGDAAESAVRPEAGRDYWYKSSLTMEGLIRKASGSPPGRNIQKELLESLTEMCSFFSEYYPLGELGVLLKKRISGGLAVPPAQNSYFRFKHNYIQKPLYDYHLIDLWLAIENGFFCRIRHTHATTLRQMEDIGIPLEIRISVNNGREYVMYYQPWEEKIKAMRIEFIDEIEMYSRLPDTIRLYKKTTKKEGKKIIVNTEMVKTLPGINEEEMAARIRTAGEMLHFLWGTEVNECFVTDDWQQSLQTYQISISYKEDTEQYIAARLHKERRALSRIRQVGKDQEREQGIVITCFPTKELRSWIRSFYQRVYISAQGRDGTTGDSFSLAEDVEDLWRLYHQSGADIKGDYQPEPAYDRDTEICFGYTIETDIKRRKKGRQTDMPQVPIRVSSHEGHEELFNEFFSKYAAASANALLRCSSEAASFSLNHFKEILREEVTKLSPFYELPKGGSPRQDPGLESEMPDIVDRLTDYLLVSQLIDRDGKTRFLSTRKDYFYDFLPLTKVEVRWLLTVLEDPLARIFFSEDLVNAGIIENLCRYLCGEPFPGQYSPAHTGGASRLRTAMGVADNEVPVRKGSLPPAGNPAAKESIMSLADFFQKPPYEAKPFSMEKINYFDRYNIDNIKTGFHSTGYRQTMREEDIRHLRTILQAMDSERKLHIRYENWKGEIRNVVCSPAWIEYSGRDNTFRVWYCRDTSQKLMKINVPRIRNLTLAEDESYDLHNEQDRTEAAVRAGTKTICVEFYRGVRNLPDRLLTEFSLWPKECEYDPGSGKYTMALHYPDFDEKEILIRLLSYGPYVKIIRDDGGYILKELKKRISRQRDLIQSTVFKQG